MPSLAGQKLDKYDMLEEVGHGGMAVVYRGRDTILDREVAVKVLHAHLADREESRRRLQREAKTVAKLHHDNIVEIFDSSDPSSGDESYIVCEFIHGVTLRDWIDERWLPRPVLAAMIAHRLCLPLEHAHSLGIVHRDIKPENVMIREDGCLKLMDFGIAQILDTQRLTTTGQLLGSPAYMAPELISGKPVDKRIDIFALGVMLYQLATSELPFAGRNPAQVLNRILETDYKRPGEINPKVDSDLAAIIAKSLAREPSDRYQSARSLANDLEDYLAALDLEADQEELASYFANPEAYADELDTRVCRVLMRKAARAMREGNSARALKLLSRVLELDPDNRRASAMLDRLRIRGQRMRQLAMIGGGLALAGIVSAGILLLQPDPPRPSQLESSEQLPRSPANGGYYIPAREPRVLTPPAEGGDETAGERLAETGETGGEDELGAGTGASGAEGGRTTGATGGKRPDPSVPCVVEIENLPATLLAGGDYHLLVPDQGRKDISGGQVRVSIDRKTVVRLSGDSYSGSATLEPESCESGPQVLRASAKPASLNFDTGGIPLSELSVSCESGCEVKNRQGDSFPKLQFPAGETEMNVELTFRAFGYRKQTRRYKLTPGQNRVPIDLEKAE